MRKLSQTAKTWLYIILPGTAVACALAFLAALAINRYAIGYSAATNVVANDTVAEEPQEPELPKIDIPRIAPKGEMHLLSTTMDDYVKREETERYMLVMTRQHTCTQMVHQEVGYIMNLDLVHYAVNDSTRTVVVTLPELQYTAVTLSSQFLADNEDFWNEVNPDTEGMKAQAANNIKMKFDTTDNRNKAIVCVQDSISRIINAADYRVSFADAGKSN